MMRRPNLFLLLTIGLIFSVSRSAHASSITINYTASVTESGLAGVSIGSIIAGSFTYETAGVDADPSPSHLQIYGNFISITAITGAFSWTWNSFGVGWVDVSNDFEGGDYFNLTGGKAFGTSNVPSLVPTGAVVSLVQFGTPPGPLASDAVPTGLILGDWPNIAQLTLALSADPEHFAIRANFTCLATSPGTCSSTAAVPEPGTLSLLGLGLVGIAQFVRRQRRGRR